MHQQHPCIVFGRSMRHSSSTDILQAHDFSSSPRSRLCEAPINVFVSVISRDALSLETGLFNRYSPVPYDSTHVDVETIIKYTSRYRDNNLFKMSLLI